MHNSAYTSTYSTLLPSLKRARIIEASEPECIRILDRLYSRNFSVNYVTNGEGEEEEGIKVPVYRFYAKSSRVLLDGPTNYTPNREFYKLSRCESARVRTVMFVITCGGEILFPMIRDLKFRKAIASRERKIAPKSKRSSLCRVRIFVFTRLLASL